MDWRGMRGRGAINRPLQLLITFEFSPIRSAILRVAGIWSANTPALASPIVTPASAAFSTWVAADRLQAH